MLAQWAALWSHSSKPGQSGSVPVLCVWSLCILSVSCGFPPVVLRHVVWLPGISKLPIVYQEMYSNSQRCSCTNNETKLIKAIVSSVFLKKVGDTKGTPARPASLASGRFLLSRRAPAC